jgi:molybdate transport system regulatory protein
MVNRTGRLRRIPMPAIDRRLRGHSLRGTDDANPAIIFTIEFARNSHVGSAQIDLLEAIHKAGSLSQAARDLRISYKHAWQLVDSLKYAFGSPVTVAKKGGNGGGGVCLTRLGESLVNRYRALEREFARLAAKSLKALAPRPESTDRGYSSFPEKTSD